MTGPRNIMAEELREEMRQDILSVLGKDIKYGASKEAYGERVEGNLLYCVNLSETGGLGIDPTDAGTLSNRRYGIQITTETPAKSTSPKAKATTIINVSSHEGKSNYVNKILEAWQELLEIKSLLGTDWRHIRKIQDGVRELGGEAVSETKFEKSERTYKINAIGFAPSVEIIGFIEGDSGVKAYVDDLKKRKSRNLLQEVLSAQARKIERD